jgi:hypothetical protein
MARTPMSILGGAVEYRYRPRFLKPKKPGPFVLPDREIALRIAAKERQAFEAARAAGTLTTALEDWGLKNIVTAIEGHGNGYISWDMILNRVTIFGGGASKEVRRRVAAFQDSLSKTAHATGNDPLAGPGGSA